MNQATIYDAWAPEYSEWSLWAKGTVFAGLTFTPDLALESIPAVPDLPWAPRTHDRVAIILDLPGAEGVLTALGLAARGYRPVPLYNAIPGIGIMPGLMSRISVDMSGLVRALWATAPQLAMLRIPYNAPPAFMLDNARRGERIPLPGDFDNRSVSFPTDFPSGNLLRNRGIHRALIVQRGRTSVQEDLAHTLRGWQSVGMELLTLDLDAPTPQPLIVKKISRLRWLLERIAMSMGLRRSKLGGYGDVIPIPSAG